MKKVFLWMGAMLTMLTMAPSCSDDMEMPEQTENPNKQPVMTIIATQGDDAESRLAYNPSADGKQINMTWTEGDALYVTDGTNFVEFTLTAGENTNKGTFTPATDATIPDTWVSGTTQLMACYKNDATLLVQQYGMSMLGLMYDNADLNVVQTQTANADMDHLLKFNHMKSDAFTYAAGESVNLKFSQMGAIMKFSLSGLSGQTVKSLKLVADEEVLSKTCIHLSNQWQIMNSSIQTLSFGDAGIALGADETLTAYMMLGATELTDGKTITLYAETAAGGFYSTTLNGGKLEAGKIYSLSRMMAERTFFGGGTGTVSDPYKLTTAQHLKDLSDWINMEFEVEKYFQLQNDIDLTDKAWTPINKLDRKVTINIDGGGHTISNLTIDESEDYAGFIANLWGGTIENLHFKDISVKSSSSGYSTGGIVGYMNGSDSRIVGCSVSGSVEAVSGSAGGIVGSLVNGTLAACLNMASVSGTSDCGGISSDNGGTIIGCVNTGTVAVNDGNNYQGAVVGYNHDTVTSCYWSSTDDTLPGIGGSKSDSQQATKVPDWTTFDFTTLNAAISTYGYEYVLNTDEATKTNEPLKLQKLDGAGN